MTPTASDLSEREQEILRLVATGASNKQIAQQLVISTNTVKVHLRNIFAKVGVSSRTEATLFAIREGLVVSPGGKVAQKESLEVIPIPDPVPVKETRQPQKEFWAVAGLIGIFIISLIGFSLRGFLFPTSHPNATSSPTHWQTKTMLPIARSGLAAAVFEKQLFAIGGDEKTGVTGEVDRFTPATNKWEKMLDIPIPVADISAVVISGRVYVPGGRLANGESSDVLQIFNPRTNKWSQGTPLPIPVSAYALASLDGKIYLFGGRDKTKILSSVYIYDPETDQWEQKTKMPTARAFAGAATVSGKIFVIGGFDGVTGITSDEIYVPENDNGSDQPWDQGTPLPATRYAMGLVSQADTIYILGGITEQASQNVPLVYLYSQNEWQEFEAPPNLPGASLTLAAMDNKIYMLGGKINSDYSAICQVYQAIYTISFPIISGK